MGQKLKNTKKRSRGGIKIFNKKANFNYSLFDRFEAGIVLMGAEVKSIRKGNIDLTQSYAKIIGEEIFLINAQIPVEGKKDYKQDRTRKLLLHRKEIQTISVKIKTKILTLVPTKVYTRRHLVKVEIALAKAKRAFQKKESKKRKDIEREVERELTRGEKRKYETRTLKH